MIIHPCIDNAAVPYMGECHAMFRSRSYRPPRPHCRMCDDCQWQAQSIWTWERAGSTFEAVRRPSLGRKFDPVIMVYE